MMKKILLILLLVPSLSRGQDKITDFICNYWAIAKQVGDSVGLHPQIILTQAAIESSWGTRVKNNNFFGVKSSRGAGALCKTVEYHDTTTVRYPHIFSITETKKGYRYVVLDWFKCYDSVEQSFYDYTVVVMRHGKSYCQPYKFYREINRYATDPQYYKLCVKVHKIIERERVNLCLTY